MYILYVFNAFTDTRLLKEHVLSTDKINKISFANISNSMIYFDVEILNFSKSLFCFKDVNDLLIYRLFNDTVSTAKALLHQLRWEDCHE